VFGVENSTALYWLYLVLAIIVSGCSLTYWVYKFTQWRRRRLRRRTRWERTRQERLERRAVLQEEHEAASQTAIDVAHELAATSRVWRPWQSRQLQARLKQLQTRQAELSQELVRLENELDVVEADAVPGRATRPPNVL
jgi:hypothetical protein